MSVFALPHSATHGTHAAERSIALWLLACCVMIYLMVVIGGITRLTESGLSITQWQPVSGVLPPLDKAQWTAEFDRYKAIPQYRAIHADMSLAQFKGIFFWEYLHRLWGRLIGMVFAVPFFWFVWRRQVSLSLAPKLAGLLVLGGLQGALGWYMVESGLSQRIEVSQYRLAAHLAAALVIYGAMLWVALDLLRPDAGAAHEHRSPALRRAAIVVLGLIAITIVAGSFVAGLRAGYIYNTFPLMGGRFVPGEYADLAPWYRNWFENPAAAQFDHRLLAEATWLAVLGLWGWSRVFALGRAARWAVDTLLAVATLQIALGISTLLLVVPLPLGVLHQAGGVLLLTAAIVTVHALRR